MDLTKVVYSRPCPHKIWQSSRVWLSVSTLLQKKCGANYSRRGPRSFC